MALSKPVMKAGCTSSPLLVIQPRRNGNDKKVQFSSPHTSPELTLICEDLNNSDKTKKSPLKILPFKTDEAFLLASLLEPRPSSMSSSKTSTVAPLPTKGQLARQLYGVLTDSPNKKGRGTARAASARQANGGRSVSRQSEKSTTKKRKSAKKKQAGASPSVQIHPVQQKSLASSKHYALTTRKSRRPVLEKINPIHSFNSPYLAPLVSSGKAIYGMKNPVTINTGLGSWNDFGDDQYTVYRPPPKRSQFKKKTTFRVESSDTELEGFTDKSDPLSGDMEVREKRFVFNRMIRKYIRKLLEVPATTNQPDNYLWFLADIKDLIDTLSFKRMEQNHLPDNLQDKVLATHSHKLYRVVQGLLVYQAELYNVSMAYANFPPDFALLSLLVLCHASREFQDVRILNITNLASHCKKATEYRYIYDVLCRMMYMQRLYLSSDQLSPEFLRSIKTRSAVTLELLSIEINGIEFVQRSLPYTSMYHYFRQYPRAQLALAIDNTQISVQEFTVIATRHIPITHIMIRAYPNTTPQELAKISHILKLIVTHCNCFIETVFLFLAQGRKFNQDKISDLMTKCAVLREVVVCAQDSPTTLISVHHQRKYLAYSNVRCAIATYRSKNAQFSHVEYESVPTRRKQIYEGDRVRFIPVIRTVGDKD